MGLFRGKNRVDDTITDDGNGKAWKALLAESRFFAVPIRKRAGADAMSSERISVGRARNKDIVLRHRSVSKFHGWFQLDEVHGLCFMDTGSKNGTLLNDKVVGGRTLVGVHPGDRLRIGRVEAIVCTPDAIWSALHRTPIRVSSKRY
jgi:pSer/pThr/pTyr-binding forkhead associated (FHA) protein